MSTVPIKRRIEASVRAVAIMRLNRTQEHPFLINTVDSPLGSKDRARQIRLHAAKKHPRMGAAEVEKFLLSLLPQTDPGLLP